MSDLVAFYGARLDDDEAAALAAGDDDPGRDWTADDNGWEGAGRVRDGHGEHVVYDEGKPTTAQALHIGRHDPARVLREVAADRALLAAYLNPDPLQGPEYGAGLRLALMFRASVWRAHPDYDPSWVCGHDVEERTR